MYTEDEHWSITYSQYAPCEDVKTRTLEISPRIRIFMVNNVHFKLELPISG